MLQGPRPQQGAAAESILAKHIQVARLPPTEEQSLNSWKKMAKADASAQSASGRCRRANGLPCCPGECSNAALNPISGKTLE
jgi:hypothetical protein